MRNIQDRVDIAPRCIECDKLLDWSHCVHIADLSFCRECQERNAQPIVKGGQGRDGGDVRNDAAGLVLTIIIGACALAVVGGVVGGWVALVRLFGS